MARFSLLRAGDLTLDVDEGLLPLVQRWIPLNAARSEASPVGRHVIACRAEEGERHESPLPLLHLTTVTAFTLDRDTIGLRGESAATGLVDLEALRSDLFMAERSEASSARRARGPASAAADPRDASGPDAARCRRTASRSARPAAPRAVRASPSATG